MSNQLWEYKIQIVDEVMANYPEQLQIQFNRLGREGWELISTNRSSYEEGGRMYTRTTFVFKRSLESR